jgi:hypothetical protein
MTSGLLQEALSQTARSLLNVYSSSRLMETGRLQTQL